MMPPLPLAIESVMPSDPNENMAVSLSLAALSFMVTVIIGRPLITALRQRGVGKKIRLDGPEAHLSKTGTPTMGGLMISTTVIIVTLIFNTYGRLSMLLPVAVLIAAGILGAVDDRMNLVGGRSTGMTGRFKMLWLTIFALIAAVILHAPDPFGLGLHHIYFPFLGRYDISIIYIPIAMFAIIGSANAMNLTDGLDTLSAGTAAIAFLAYGIIAYKQGQLGVVTFCMTMCGSLLGFLWFNAHPAQVFMGDTGSLSVGASLAVAAFMTGQWLLLPIVGFVFLAEAGSVMMQVAYFKLTKGKRIFRMTPLHHHFELIGWSETQITMRFWLIGMMAGLLGVALALL